MKVFWRGISLTNKESLDSRPNLFGLNKKIYAYHFSGRKPVFLILRFPEMISVEAWSWKPWRGWVPRNYCVVDWRKKSFCDTLNEKEVKDEDNHCYVKPKRDKKHGVGSPSGAVWKSRVFTFSSWMQARIICWNCSNPTALKRIKLPLQSVGSVHAEELLGRACKCLTLIVRHIGTLMAD